MRRIFFAVPLTSELQTLAFVDSIAGKDRMAIIDEVVPHERNGEGDIARRGRLNDLTTDEDASVCIGICGWLAHPLCDLACWGGSLGRRHRKKVVDSGLGQPGECRFEHGVVKVLPCLPDALFGILQRDAWRGFCMLPPARHT